MATNHAKWCRIQNGVFAVTLAPFSVQPAMKVYLPAWLWNQIEDETIVGNVAGWGLFTQHEQCTSNVTKELC